MWCDVGYPANHSLPALSHTASNGNPACPSLQVRVQVMPGHNAAEVLIAMERPTHFQGQGPTLSCPLSLPACLRDPPPLFAHSLRPVSLRLPSPALPLLPPASPPQVRVQVTPGHDAAEVIIAAERPTRTPGQDPAPILHWWVDRGVLDRHMRLRGGLVVIVVADRGGLREGRGQIAAVAGQGPCPRPALVS